MKRKGRMAAPSGPNCKINQRYFLTEKAQTAPSPNRSFDVMEGLSEEVAHELRSEG